MYLNCHSYFSYKYGTLSPKNLLQAAAAQGLKSLALTDINSTSACMETVRLAADLDLKIIIGIDFRNGAEQQYIALAKNNDGFRAINAHLSSYLTTEKPLIPSRAPALEHTYIIYPLERYDDFPLLDYEYIGVRPEQLTSFRRRKVRIDPSRLVVLQTVSYQTKAQYNAHKLLRAIGNNTLLSTLPPNEMGAAHHCMFSIDRLRKVYADHPYILHNTERMVENCSIAFEFGTEHSHHNQKCYTGSERDDLQLIKQLYTDGIDYRFAGQQKTEVLQRIDKELDIIQKKGFLSYFLINWDITSYARKQGYFYVGRGSGANSLIAYLLRITDVDPIELDLYFERFINLYRKNPPDFDIDFSWTDRADITRYIFDRFEHTSLVGAYVTFQRKAIIRELGKVFGLPKREIDILSKGQYRPYRLDKTASLVLKYGALIHDFPSHCSVHSSGILIAQNDLHSYGTTFLPPKGFATSDFDMVIAEDAGLYKFDILAQRGLGKIKDSIQLVAENQNILIDAHDIQRFKKDPQINDKLKKGEAMGCFYVESPAMRGLLCKLEVDSYLGLVAASSIIRPGVSQSGMMREYIKRFRYPETRKEAHPILLQIMPDTFGVMVYQEDVIKVAHYFAGLSLAESDVLRRGMSGKFRSRSEFDQVKQKYFDNCAAKGHSRDLASEVWRQIESFAGYAFAKGHSASYAVESYQSLFLKTYYPIEYMVATVNNGGGYYRMEDYLHEAKMHGAQVEPPCINRSEGLCSVAGTTVFIGLGFLKELENETAHLVLKERKQFGSFRDFNDFIDRTAISLDQASILIRADAFRFTGQHKRALLWEAHFKLSKRPQLSVQRQLFAPAAKHFDLPQLQRSWLEDAFDQIELLGYTLYHPYQLLEEKPSSHLLASDLPAHKGKTVCIWGYLIQTKTTRTIKGDVMNFGCFLDEKGHFFDSTSFPQIAAKYPYRGRGVYELKGVVAEEFGFYSIEVIALRKIDVIPDPRYSDRTQRVPDANYDTRQRKKELQLI